ncbi:MAG: hypothetical protein NTX36_03470 [Proteobacteria bacterium]|nr:hypothetical protein [Pseudomonadota bacterium]
MKKVIVVMLALFLAIPAITYAGSVTSRYDVTIGGYVKFDVGYSTQTQGQDYRVPNRASTSAQQQINDEFGNVSWADGETRLNILVKGPDAWGAKTGAFIEGDFRGVAGSSANYGTFTLRHAFMDFNWVNTKLLIGHTWQAWGLIPSFNMLAFSENHFMKGATRTPQVRLTQKLAKNFRFQFALSAPYQELVGNSGANFSAASMPVGLTQNSIMDRTRALVPDTSLEFVYSSDACGKIGPWNLQFGLGGMIGQEKVTYQDWGTPVGTTSYSSTNITKWGSSFWGYIPIIPEKKGNKAGALGFTGNAFTGQGLGDMLPAYPGTGIGSGAYNQNNVALGIGNGAALAAAGNGSIQPVYPLTYGGWMQLNYYFTDSVSANFLYGFQQNKLSDAYSNIQANAGNLVTLQNYVANVFYDVNPAVRLGIEYTYITTGYAQVNTSVVPGVAGDSKGSIQAVRIGAYYFF